MRHSVLKDNLAARGATFTARHGVEICAETKGFETEYAIVRDACGITDFSNCRIFTVPEETGIDFLDKLVAGNAARIRFGRVLHTFIADAAGNLVADCYIANNDEEFVLVAETIVSDEAFDAILAENGGAEAGLVDLTGTHAAITIDGYKAWAVVKEQFGADVLGLPYLSIEMYEFDGEPVRFFRLGKTSEFGYLTILPVEKAPAFFDTLVGLAELQGGGACGNLVHNNLRLEGRFFNIFAEGETVCEPLTLGLQWMIDFDKESFIGSEAIFAKRETGSSQKIIGIKTDAKGDAIAAGTKVCDDTGEVATVVTSTWSPVLGASVALALFPVEIAFAGLEFAMNDGTKVETISMPPIIPKSLTVKLDEM